MIDVLFNRSPLTFAGKIEQPTDLEVKATPALWNASLDDALRYGGDLTRAAIGAMDLKGDRKHVVVDTKVHMLKPGFWPAIPGWHTDGVPRGVDTMSPLGPMPPDMRRQEGASSPRYHLLVTGVGCLTEFVAGTNLLVDELPEADTSLYKIVDQRVNEMLKGGYVHVTPSCRVIEFDWWQLHRAVQATASEWRYLIRVTETDHLEPQGDLRQVIRTQQQVYVPESFGW